MSQRDPNTTTRDSDCIGSRPHNANQRDDSERAGERTDAEHSERREQVRVTLATPQREMNDCDRAGGER